MKRNTVLLLLIASIAFSISANSQTTVTSLQSKDKTASVKCSGFSINLLANNIPSLSWVSNQDGKTDFEVLRSYDGVEFTTVALVFSMSGTITYQYKDKQVNNQSGPVYYRIKAIENGVSELSEVKIIRFDNK